MKKIIILGICSLVVAVAVSCDKESSENPPAIPALNVSSSIAASVSGGVYYLTYSIENPDDDGELACVADVSWITDINLSRAETVSFLIDENDTEDLRAGNLTISYRYSGGYLTKKVGVVQYTVDTPDIIVDPTIMVESDGGKYGFSYEIHNEPDRGYLTCSSNVSWISAFDYSEDGMVNFSVTKYTGTEMRSGIITITYDYVKDAVSKQIAVVQYHPLKGDVGVYDGDMSSLVGTYLATGTSVVPGTTTVQETTWTVRIYDWGSSLMIDGLTPAYEDYYTKDGVQAYLASAYLSDGHLVIPSQLTGYFVVTYLGYLGWTPCVSYNSAGVAFDTGFIDCTLSYYPLIETWESDYGEMSVLFSDFSMTVDNFMGFTDVTVPTFTIKKIDDSTIASLSIGPDSEGEGAIKVIEDNTPLRTDFHAENAVIGHNN